MTQLAEEATTWCEIEEVVAVGRAYRAILRRATDANTDLIVMGAQGTGGLVLMLHGSNTQHVVRAAAWPGADHARLMMRRRISLPRRADVRR